MKPVKVADNVYHLHTFTMGNGYGVYEIKLKGAESDQSVETVEDNIVKPVVTVEGGILSISSTTALGTVSLYSITGAEVRRVAAPVESAVIDVNGLPHGIYIINVYGQQPVKVML